MRSTRGAFLRGFNCQKQATAETETKTESQTMKATLKFTLLLGAAVATMNVAAIAGPGPLWPHGYPKRVNTKEEAADCCKARARVALACPDCKTTAVGKNGKGIMAWFKPDSTHDCSGCGGRITVKYSASGKGAPYGTYKHVCSKCGKDSPYVCTDHKKA